MNKYRVLFFIIFCCITFISRVSGQGTSDDRSSQQAGTYIANDYRKSIGKQSELYRGAAYEFYDIKSIGSPYFKESSAFNNGTLSYDGVVYKDVPLLYDQYRRLLVTLLYNNYSKLSLLSEYVSEFNLQGHHFIRLQPNEQNPKIDADFYDELYNNKLQLVVRRIKSLEGEGLTGRKVYRLKENYYLKKGDIYYSVNTNGQLWDVLDDKKKELKRYLKDKNIKLGDDRERAMLMLVTYYDQISN